MDELLEQFLIEGRELVQLASDGLLALERDPANTAHIDGVFRAIHTLKGSVGLFDLAPMSAAIHAAEDLIGALRDGRLVADRATIDVLLECIDATDRWIDAIASTGSLPSGAAERGARLATALRAPLGTGRTDAASTSADWLAALLARYPHSRQGLTALRYIPARDCFFLGDDPLALVRAVPGLVALHVEPAEPWVLETFDTFTCNLVIDALSTAPADAVTSIFRFVADQVVIVAVPASDNTSNGADSLEAFQDVARRTLRVDATRVDAMVDIVGELIVAKNGLAHLIGQAATAAPALAKALRASHSDIERLVGEMHRAVMGARMVPLSRTLRRFPRMVHDIAGKLGRQVRFDVSGGDIEADRAIVDGLYEPLLHMLRNAIDHGIETADIRTAAGKPPIGRIALDISRDADQIVIAVADDGAGIDPAQLRQTAKARRVASDAAIDAMGDPAVLDLLFTPGFSTAAAITNISGRGVGMDAVRAAVTALGGVATITSRLGAGSNISLRLPQAVAITTIVIVRVGEERFGVPIDIVAETARIALGDIQPVQGGAAFVLRDRTIPILQLTDLLHLQPAVRTAPHTKVLIVSTGGQLVGVAVDALDDRSDVLLRPLSGLLAGVPGLLGAALLGDGRMLMVLDLPGLIG
jgi:two-component system, chemotaxis family, sensor kinase CheA